MGESTADVSENSSQRRTLSHTRSKRVRHPIHESATAASATTAITIFPLVPLSAPLHLVPDICRGISAIISRWRDHQSAKKGQFWTQ